MQKVIRRMRRSGGFTLVELMIVVVIVAILALVAIPLYSGNVLAAKMSEGIAGVGSIRTALRVYAAGNGGSFPDSYSATGATATALGVGTTDLNGKYFQATNYAISSTKTGYTVTATSGSNTYAVDHTGKETGTYTTGN